MSAVAQIYAEGGIRGYWVGNGLNTLKIFPVSSMLFLAHSETDALAGISHQISVV
jgi:solute carrier family 25 (mitochondrial phosphate transporter), member 23/24/25/41